MSTKPLLNVFFAISEVEIDPKNDPYAEFEKCKMVFSSILSPIAVQRIEENLLKKPKFETHLSLDSVDSGFESDDEIKAASNENLAEQVVPDNNDETFELCDGQEIKNEILQGILKTAEFIPNKKRNLRILALKNSSLKRNLNTASTSNSAQDETDLTEKYCRFALIR